MVVEPKLIDERFLSVSKANILERQIPVNNSVNNKRGFRHPGSAINKQNYATSTDESNSYQKVFTNQRP